MSIGAGSTLKLNEWRNIFRSLSETPVSVANEIVTRLGEISPLWQKFKSLWLFCESFFALGKIWNLIGQFFMILVKFSLMLMPPYWKDNLGIWSHWSQTTSSQEGVSKIWREILRRRTSRRRPPSWTLRSVSRRRRRFATIHPWNRMLNFEWGPYTFCLVMLLFSWYAWSRTPR